MISRGRLRVSSSALPGVETFAGCSSTTRSSAGEAVPAYLGKQFDALVTQDLLARRDAPDAVHQLRVAARRLRSALQAYRPLLDSARTPWDGVAFFVGLGHEGGPLPDIVAAAKLKQVEADVKADPLAFNRGMFFDREGRHLRIDEAAR